jgi:hypothetical protein
MLSREAVVLTDLDALLWQAAGIDPIAALRARSRLGPTVGVWPGTVNGRIALYSKQGRPDYYERALSDVVVLRPVTTRYPDEIPYTLERIAP